MERHSSTNKPNLQVLNFYNSLHFPDRRSPHNRGLFLFFSFSLLYLNYTLISRFMEILDIVNLNDEIISQAERKEVYEKKHLHRIVHVLIFNDQGELAIQKRSEIVSFCPNHWSTAVGGHVQTGETYGQAALREFMEELGVQNKIEFWRKDFYDVPDIPNKFITTFRTTYNGPFNINLEDVAEIHFFPLAEIQKMISAGEKFHPELIFILQKML